MALENFKAPALPLPPAQYSQQYVARFNQLLRLYFNQLDSEAANKAYSYRAEHFIGQGQDLILPHIAASDSTSQYATAVDTPTLVLWDTLESSSGFTLNPAGYAVADYSGVYKIDYSIQLANTDGAAHDAFIWLVVNGGTPVPNSSSQYTLPARKSAGVYSYVVAYSSVTFFANAGDAIRLYWASDAIRDSGGTVDGIYMPALPAQTTPYVRPANPSAVGSIVFVSAS